jgi:signal transduction histidine kinase
LNDLLERLDHAVARERQFVADASHELRTPITSTRLLLENESLDAASVMHARAEALARLGHLQDLIDDLLVLAKADETRAGSLSTAVDLDELVLAQARQLERTTDLRIDVANVSGGQVIGRDTDLGRVVENLATNAARYATTTVAFSVVETCGNVEFRVRDDGPGIAPSDRTRIFERFSTVDDECVGRRRGAGLGLSIASAIVSAHDGTIQVEDTPGPGATFVVRLPVATAGTAPDRTAVRS